MRTRRVSWPRHALAVTFAAVGCANFLGFEEPTKVACISSADCAVGFTCIDGQCECSGECAAGGESGAGRTGGAAGSAGGQTPAGGGSGEGGKTASGGASSTAGQGGGAGDAGGSLSGAGFGGDGAGEQSAGGSATNGGSSINAGGSTTAGSSTAGGASGKEGGAGAGSVSGEAGGAGAGGVGGEAGGAGAGGAGECIPDDPRSCLLCDVTEHHVPGSPCPAACREGREGRECFIPPSCGSLSATCPDGEGHEESCCLSLPVPDGAFERSCDDFCTNECLGSEESFPGSVSAFSLDAFEVAVVRFRAFVNQYPGSKPKVGDGKNPNNEADRGWLKSWNDFLPETSEALIAQLSADGECGDLATWPEFAEDNDHLPINCVNWYVAQAFCIWDGGRLPTQLEWNYVAAGGDEQRVYPWSKPPSSELIDSSHAVYGCSLDPSCRPAEVGSRPAGRGKWGHYDLAGNLWEWVWDGVETCYSVRDCHDCGLTEPYAEKLQVGGCFLNDSDRLMVEARGGALGTNASPIAGFRCARNF